MKNVILVSFLILLIIGCSAGRSQRTAREVPPEPPVVEIPEHGLYDRPLALVTYEVINQHLGADSRLTADEKKVFWETIRGRDVVWTGTLVEVGERRPLAVPAKLQVGRKSRSWDTLVFFNPEHEQKLRRQEIGDSFSFRASLESFEQTTLGVQVTVVQGRFPQEEAPPTP